MKDLFHLVAAASLIGYGVVEAIKGHDLQGFAMGLGAIGWLVAYRRLVEQRMNRWSRSYEEV